MQARVGVLAALVAVVVAVAACGGGGGGRLSTEEYVDQADAICRTTDQEQEALGEAPSDLPGLASYLEKQKAIGEKQLASLRALAAPEELEDDLDEAYGLLDQVIGKLDEAIAAASAGDVDRLTAVADEAGQLSGQADAIAKDVGLTVCGQG